VFHQTIVYGRVGKDPEVRYTGSGQAVANFSVAVTEKGKDKAGAPKEHTTWYEVQVWSKLAELCGEYVHKGDMVHVVGRMNVREWEAQDGGKRKTWELVAANVVFAPRKGGGGAPGSEGYGMSDEEREIPF